MIPPYLSLDLISAYSMAAPSGAPGTFLLPELAAGTS
jgi:hypothetical protein